MNTKMMSYNEAKAYLKPLGFKDKEEYAAWWNTTKPDFLPQFPEEYYSKLPLEETETLIVMNSIGIITKEKTELIKKVSKLSLSAKENKLFQKILGKGIKKWNNKDVEFLTLLYDMHHYPVLSMGVIDIYPYEQHDQIQREAKAKRENAIKRLTEEPYSLWFKDARHYK